ncbi:DUF551 domain-containing protein [Escherichia coli]|uniref:DUF551 domain-containing protein n=1 Tax=Escherichia coli TaxID=562 RepID=UPI001D0C71D3|nr:DUF551 domain-containing protein [Escherichia coli]
MTTNHPAHGPVSLDRLHQIREILSKAAAQSDGGNLGYAMADAVKVIDGAIAAFGVEPVEFLPDNLDRALTILGVALPISKEEFNLDAERWMQRLINRVIRLESELIPPSPEAMKDHQIRELVNDLRDIAIEYHGTQQLRERIALTVRAAMLQGAEQQNQQQNIPENIPTLRDGLVAIRKSGIAIDGEKIQAERDALNSPVTPDGWIPVSERMPGRSGVYMVWNGKHIGAVSLFFGSFQCIKPEQITHWRHMPAAPQEEKTERKK